MKIDSAGWFVAADGVRFVPVGANYWPASCGVEMWQAWPEAEIIADLDLMASLGFNTVRVFLRWPDFEPRAGEYDEVMFGRLERLTRLCLDRGIHPQPSLFVGWMSGGTFWPEWKGTRNVFADAEVTRRGEAYAREAARRLAPFAAELAGIDLGNELNALPESREASPAAVRAWCARMTAAVRDVLPDVVMLSGCDHQQVTADTGWRLGDQPGIDVITMHGYPVPGWHPVPSGGLQDPLTRSLLPFYVKCARAFGPVLLQEFGTILTRHAAYADGYLRAILPACREAGANGFLWWCFRDIPARVHPYMKGHFESDLGLVDESGRVKDGLRYFVEFTREITRAAARPTETPPDAAVYWPAHYYHRDTQHNPGNSPHEVSRRMIAAHHLLEKTGRRVGIVRGDQPLSPDLRTIIIAGSFPSVPEMVALRVWVENGGWLLWHGPDPVNWAEDLRQLLGAEIADYHAPAPLEATLAGLRYRFDSFPRGMRLEVTSLRAHVMLTDDAGRPFVLKNRLDKGSVTCVLADVEGSVLGQWLTAPSTPWVEWYRQLLLSEEPAVK